MIGILIGILRAWRVKLIPQKESALFWLTGKITFDGTNYYFEDRSVYARHFLISNYDFPTTWSTGIPYKTAATISAPAADAVLIAADVNNFLYDSGGTPNKIPVVSLFQNIDYADKLFSRHEAQIVDINGVETYEARVKDIVLYSSARTGADLTICNTYFSVSTRDASSEWISKLGNDLTGNGDEATPYLTVVKGVSVVGSGKTVYVKSGLFDENGSFTSLYLANSLAVKGLGLSHITAPSTTRVVYSNALTTVQLLKNLIIDGENDTATGIEIQDGGSQNKTIENVLVKATTNNAIEFEASSTNNIVKNAVITSPFTQITARGILSILNSLFSGNCEIGVNVVGSTLTLSNSRFNNKSSLSQVYFTGTSTVNILGCEFNLSVSAKSIYAVNSATAIGTINITSSKFSGRTTSTPIELPALVAVDLSLDDCEFRMISTHVGSIITLTNQSSPTIKNSIFEKLETTASVDPFIKLTSNGTQSDDALISNNLFLCHSQNGYPITIGSEGGGVWSDKLLNSVIEKNSIFGTYHFTGATDCNVHAIMVNHQKNFNVKYNKVDGSGIALITKANGCVGEDAVFQYNFIRNCKRPIYINGIENTQVFNNTIINDLLVPSTSVVFIAENNGFGAKNTVLKNNIFIGNVAMINVDALSTGLVSDYNIFYRPDGSNVSFVSAGVTYTFAQWQALGFDTHSIVLTTEQYNGLFTDTDNGDFSLKAGSIAIGAGVDLGTDYNDGLDASTDWGSDIEIPVVVTKQQGETWDCGAYIS